MGDNPVLLTRIFVSPGVRGNGHGRKLLEIVCVEADREYKNLMLSVDPDPGMDWDRLIKFYMSFDFVLLNDDSTMLRKWRRLPKPKVW